MFVFQHLLFSTYFGNIFTMIMLETDLYAIFSQAIIINHFNVKICEEHF